MCSLQYSLLLVCYKTKHVPPFKRKQFAVPIQWIVTSAKVYVTSTKKKMAANYIKTNFVCHSYAMYNKSKNGERDTTTG